MVVELIIESKNVCDFMNLTSVIVYCDINVLVEGRWFIACKLDKSCVESDETIDGSTSFYAGACRGNIIFGIVVLNYNKDD
jgi:hypothetical protein